MLLFFCLTSLILMNFKIVSFCSSLLREPSLPSGSKAKGLVDLEKLHISFPEALLISGSNKEYLKEEVRLWLNEICKYYQTEVGGVMKNGHPLLFSLRFPAKNNRNIYPSSLIYLGLSKISFLNFKSVDQKKDLELQTSGYWTDKASQIYELPPQDQIIKAIDHALSFLNNIPDYLDKTLILQRMVYGNVNRKSFSGMCYTRHPYNGRAEDYGRFRLAVTGNRYAASSVDQKINFKTMRKIAPDIYIILRRHLDTLEEYYKDIRYVEFVYDGDQLYLLQNTEGNRTASLVVKSFTEYLSLRDFSFSLSCEREKDLDCIKKYLTPHLTVSVADDSEWEIQVKREHLPLENIPKSQPIVFARSQGKQELKGLSWCREKYHYIANSKSGSVICINFNEKKAVVYGVQDIYRESLHSCLFMDVMSLLRLLSRRHIESDGQTILLHGIALSLPNKGVLICGGKRGGKSTIQLSLLKKAGGRYISSDRSYVGIRDCNMELFGFPDTVRISNDEFSLLPDNATIPNVDFIGNDKVAMTANDFLKYFQYQSTDSCLLDTIILSQYCRDKPARIRKATIQEKQNYLKENNFTLYDPTYIDWIEHISPNANEKQAQEKIVIDKLCAMNWIVAEGNYDVLGAMKAMGMFDHGSPNAR